VRLRTCLNHRIFPLPLHNRHSRLSPAVPECWHYEVGSALLKAMRSRRLSAAKIRTAMALLDSLPPESFAVQLQVSEACSAGLRFTSLIGAARSMSLR
jgi:hypothetical protein